MNCVTVQLKEMYKDNTGLSSPNPLSQNMLMYNDFYVRKNRQKINVRNYVIDHILLIKNKNKNKKSLFTSHGPVTIFSAPAHISDSFRVTFP